MAKKQEKKMKEKNIEKNIGNITISGAVVQKKDLMPFTLSLMIVLIIFISGCQGFNNISFFNPYTGSEGLTTEFLKNSPPDIVYETSQFGVGVVLENRGALDIKNGLLIVGADDFGTDNKIIIGSDNKKFNLYGKKESRTYRGEKIIEFFDLKAPELKNKTQQEISVSVKACYEYQTTAQIPICLDTILDPVEEGRRACRMRDEISLSDQGAPVAVTLVETSRIFKSRERMQFAFTIHVRNVGNGRVVNSGSIEKFCSSSSKLSDTDFGRVRVSASLGFKELKCEPRTDVDISQGDDFLTCYTEEMPVSNNAYTTVLNVKLNYGYVNLQTKRLTIKRLT